MYQFIMLCLIALIANTVALIAVFLKASNREGRYEKAMVARVLRCFYKSVLFELWLWPLSAINYIQASFFLIREVSTLLQPTTKLVY